MADHATQHEGTALCGGDKARAAFARAEIGGVSPPGWMPLPTGGDESAGFHESWRASGINGV